MIARMGMQTKKQTLNDGKQTDGYQKGSGGVVKEVMGIIYISKYKYYSFSPICI